MTEETTTNVKEGKCVCVCVCLLVNSSTSTASDCGDFREISRIKNCMMIYDNEDDDYH